MKVYPYALLLIFVFSCTHSMYFSFFLYVIYELRNKVLLLYSFRQVREKNKFQAVKKKQPTSNYNLNCMHTNRGYIATS